MVDGKPVMRVQTLAQYEKMAQDPSFARSVQEGLAMENPAWSRWRLYSADQLANPVTYARFMVWLGARMKAFAPLGSSRSRMNPCP